MRRPVLTYDQILQWADQVHRETGDWPTADSGHVKGADEDWCNIDAVLQKGQRGLPKSSLAKLLAKYRNRRNQQDLPELRERQIVKWADAWKRKNRAYPTRTSGPIPGVNGETWARVNAALINGYRGLPGGSSLARLLAEYRDVPNIQALPDLVIAEILRWVDSYKSRERTWPNEDSGDIPEAPGHTWKGIDSALRKGTRGLQGGSSIARLLAKHRSVRNEKALPKLTERGIWVWIVTHQCRTGSWPNSRSGTILGTRSEKWSAVDAALRCGSRGLPGGSSLGDLIARKIQATKPVSI